MEWDLIRNDGRLVQKAQGGKTVLTTDRVVLVENGRRGCIWSKITQNQLFAERELQAREGVALLHFGVLTLLGDLPRKVAGTHNETRDLPDIKPFHHPTCDIPERLR